MLLYHAVTNWQIMACVLHKLRFFPKESAELLVPSFVQRKIPKLHIRTQTFFSDVGTYETTETKTWNAGHRFGGYRLEDFDGIYVAGAQFPFSYSTFPRQISKQPLYISALRGKPVRQ